MKQIIIDRKTRIILKTTIDPNYVCGEREEAVTVDELPQFEPGFWKLDENNQKVAATEQEIDDADVDEARIDAKRKKARKEYKEKIQELAADQSLPKQLQEYFQILAKLI